MPESDSFNTEIEEKDFLFDKTYQCPCCEMEISSRTIRTGKARLIGADPDMRPRYEKVEPLKYDVIMCDVCGYTALSRFFTYLTAGQKKLIQEKISMTFNPPTVKETYSYADALERYKMALACSVVKNAKASEKAYICLKMGWLARSYAESLEQDFEEDTESKQKAMEMEDAFLHNAYDGFLMAIGKEDFPMCGMDEVTIDYLLATLAARFGQYDTASKLVASVLTSRSANTRMKDRARDLKEQILQKRREGEA